MSQPADLLDRTARLGRTTRRRFCLELTCSAVLGCVTTVAVTALHARMTPLTEELLMTHGHALADAHSPPRWFATLCRVGGATGILSRDALGMDPLAVQYVLESQQAGGAVSLPSWSHLSADGIVPHGTLLEQAHGWPALMLVRTEHIENASSDAARRMAILPVGAVINALFYCAGWLFVIRLPGSVRRAVRWREARMSHHVPPLPQSTAAHASHTR